MITIYWSKTAGKIVNKHSGDVIKHVLADKNSWNETLYWSILDIKNHLNGDSFTIRVSPNNYAILSQHSFLHKMFEVKIDGSFSDQFVDLISKNQLVGRAIILE